MAEGLSLRLPYVAPQSILPGIEQLSQLSRLIANFIITPNPDLFELSQEVSRLSCLSGTFQGQLATINDRT